MIGQGSPNSRLTACAARLAAMIVLCACWAGGLAVHGAQTEVRLRIAWGSGGQSPRQWHGKITVADAEFRLLQPLGIEADESAALRLEGGEIIVSPLVDRAFDGCDVTIRGDEQATLKFELRSSATANSPVVSIETPVAKAAKEPFTASLDAAGAGLLVHRSPGDKLRVSFERDHLVFAPNEEFSLGVVADLKTEAAATPLSIEAQVVRTGHSEVLWSTTAAFDPAAEKPIPFVLNAPLTEGAYRLRLTAGHRPEGLATRLTPWETTKVVATRDIEFVVIDPEKPLARLTSKTTLVETIDPASSSWWQRIPSWTQVDKLPAFATPRPLGNLKPRPVPGSDLGMVELPAHISGEPAWQAYVLPIREPGEPYVVEVELPQGRPQAVSLSVIEPDAAGRVTTFGRDSGAFADDRVGAAGKPGGVDVHRIDFWPRSRSPVLLVANQSGTRAAHFGKIRLLRRSLAATPEAEAASTQPQRLVAAYIGTPQFADAFGAAEALDPTSGLSVDGWGTFLQGSARLAQQLRAAGYNAAILSVAANGGSLAPIDALGAAPRYDTGLLSGGGVDPVRKDVLEALLRVFDREGLRLIPAVQLAAPLAGLEAKREGSDPQVDGFVWIGADGRRWSESHSQSAEAPHYNLLNEDVQKGISQIVEQLTGRYDKHPSMAGVALQLSTSGYGVLPGAAWGFDDATAARFAGAAKIELPAAGDDRFAKRAALLLGAQREPWRQWRTAETTAFYAHLAGLIRRQRPELELVLCTEELFAGTDAILASSGAGKASRELTLDELGIDAKRLSATPGVTMLRPRRIGVELPHAPSDLPASAAAELDQAVDGPARGGELHVRNLARLRLPSFDAQSPYGAEATHLSLQAPSSPVGDASRRALAVALANRDFALLADGCELGMPSCSTPYSALLRTIQELPLTAEVRTERRQPVTLRVYRTGEATTVCLVNESPWQVDVELPLAVDAATAWRRLGIEQTAATADPGQAAEGTLAAGSQTWKVALPAFSIEARRFADRGLKVGTFTPAVGEEARGALQVRVAELEQRMRSLDVERDYLVLDNPGFELAADAAKGWGWEPRVGEAGSVEVDATTARTGGKSLHLRSETTLGVAAQSQQFAIPATGKLTVRAHVRTRGLKPEARLYAWMEYDVAGKPRQRYRELGSGQTLGEQWTACEFALDDLPTNGGKMRIQFHLAGEGEAWFDDVRLHDLQFSEAQRVELFKRLYAANAALDEGQLVDCERLVDGQWARHLMEHVPPASLASNAPILPTPAPAAAGDGATKGIGGRIRDIVPRVWR